MPDYCPEIGSSGTTKDCASLILWTPRRRADYIGYMFLHIDYMYVAAFPIISFGRDIHMREQYKITFPTNQEETFPVSHSEGRKSTNFRFYGTQSAIIRIATITPKLQLPAIFH